MAITMLMMNKIIEEKPEKKSLSDFKEN